MINPLMVIGTIMEKLLGLVKHFVPAKRRVREEVKAEGEGQLARGEYSLQFWQERLGWSGEAARYLATAFTFGVKDNLAAVLDEAQRIDDSGDFEGKFTKRLKEDLSVIGPALEASKFVSFEELRDLLGRILNGDVSRPGSVARRTVSVAQDLTPLDLQEFLKLRSVSWRSQDPDSEEQDFFVVIGSRVGVFGKEFISFDPKKIGMDYHTFGEFQQLGLIQERSEGVKIILSSGDEFNLICGQRIATVRMNEGDDQLIIGKHILTKAGAEILKIFLDEDFPPLEGYFEEVCEYWRTLGFEVVEVGEDAEKRIIEHNAKHISS